MGEPIDLERSRLLLVWLQSRRTLDHALSEMLASGPAGERRVRERFELVEHLVDQSDRAFRDYRAAVRKTGESGRRRWLSAAEPGEGEDADDPGDAGKAGSRRESAGAAGRPSAGSDGEDPGSGERPGGEQRDSLIEQPAADVVQLDAAARKR